MWIRWEGRGGQIIQETVQQCWIALESNQLSWNIGEFYSVLDIKSRLHVISKTPLQNNL